MSKYDENAPWADRVEAWAIDRNLVNGSDPSSQFGKLLEESVVLYQALLADDFDEIKDAVGDCLVVLRIMFLQVELEWFGVASPVKRDFSDLLGSFAELPLDYTNPHSYADCIADLDFIANDNQTTSEECKELAWEAIKDRTGKMVDGVFVKDSPHETCIVLKDLPNDAVSISIESDVPFEETPSCPSHCIASVMLEAAADVSEEFTEEDCNES